MLELQVPLLAAKALILLLLFAFIYAVMSRSIGDLRKIRTMSLTCQAGVTTGAGRTPAGAPSRGCRSW
jgi:hypothetical protein